MRAVLSFGVLLKANVERPNFLRVLRRPREMFKLWNLKVMVSRVTFAWQRVKGSVYLLPATGVFGFFVGFAANVILNY